MEILNKGQNIEDFIKLHNIVFRSLKLYRLSFGYKIYKGGKSERECKYNDSDSHAVAVRGIGICLVVHIAEEYLACTVGAASRHGSHKKKAYIDGADYKERKRCSQSGMDKRKRYLEEFHRS